MKLKAIETQYKGYRFRSRLEARWAVFFDACGVEWLYENEGYDLPSGYYLPDFWLPKEECFIEIKPGPLTEKFYSSIEDLHAWHLMCLSRDCVYVLFGDPVEALAPGYPGMAGYKPMLPDETGEFTIPAEGLSFLYLTNYKHAAIKARQARFEFGQSGAPA